MTIELLSKPNDHHFELNIYGKSHNKFIKGRENSFIRVIFH